MTLSTDIIVCEPINPERVFKFALDLLARAVDFEPTWEHTPAGEGKGFDNGHYVSTCGQGLPAWLWVHYATDGPLTRFDPEDYEDDPEWSMPWFNEHLVRIDFDTAYGYKGPQGQRAGTLHAWLVTEVCAWLADQGITKVVWHDECGGGWYSHDDYGACLKHLGDPLLGALHPKGIDGAGGTGEG